MPIHMKDHRLGSNVRRFPNMVKSSLWQQIIPFEFTQAKLQWKQSLLSITAVLQVLLRRWP